MKKRILAIMSAVFLAAGLLAPLQYGNQGLQTVEAAPAKGQGKDEADKDTDGNGTTDTGFIYTKGSNQTATITGYSGGADVKVPTSIEVSVGTAAAVKYNVTAIKENAFKGKTGIKSVTMSGGMNAEGKQYGLTTIGDRAFAGCPDLTKVELPVTLSSYGTEVFADCVALTDIKVADGNQYFKAIEGSLYSYSMQSGTGTYTLLQTPIGKKEKEFKVPEAVQSTLVAIGPGAFWGNTSLEKMEIPTTVKTVGDRAFYQCTGLTELTIPANVQSLGNSAFAGCKALKSVTSSADLTNIPASAFQDCEALEAIDLPESLVSIEAKAFYGCKALKSVKIPSQVVSIGDQAFAECSGLTDITIPQRTSKIGSHVFLHTTVTIYCHDGSKAAAYAASNQIVSRRIYTVTFYGDANFWTSTLLSTQEVLEGGSATPPEMEKREGYVMSWVGQYTGVTQDSSVYAKWARACEVTFIDNYTGQKETKLVEVGTIAQAPAWTNPGYQLSWTNNNGKYIDTAIDSDTTFYARWVNEKTGYVIDQYTKKPKSIGTLLTAKKLNYKVTSANPQKPEVRFEGVTVSGASVKIPATITRDKVTYYVTAVKKGCLKGDTGLKKAVIGKNVKKIEKKAFYKCANLKKVVFRSKSVSSMGSKAFGKLHKKARFYAYYSKMGKYRKLLKKAGAKKPQVYRLT